MPAATWTQLLTDGLEISKDCNLLTKDEVQESNKQESSDSSSTIITTSWKITSF